MNHYEEGINAMWEEVEGKKPESIPQPSDKERWKEFVEKYSHRGFLVQSEFGVIDITDDAMKDVAGGENLSYEEYLQVLFNSRNIIRHCFEYCYRGIGIANEGWREGMRQTLFNSARENKK